MNKNIIFCAIAILLLLPGLAYSGDFRCEKVGQTTGYGHMVIAPARNDGINRLYTGGKFPYEFTWTGSGWQKDSLTEIPSYINSLAAGFGRNDSIWRLYAGDEIGSRLWEYSYDTVAQAWDRAMIDDRSQTALWAVTLGDIKNDDTIRVVAGGDDSATVAYTYQKADSTWKKDSLGVKREKVWVIAIGNGHNNDTNRVYSGGLAFWSEYTFRDNKWDSTLHYSFVKGMALAKAKEDSAIRLYIAGGLMEQYWDGISWNSTGIDSINSNGQIVCNDGRNDGEKRLYTVSEAIYPIDTLYTWVYLFEYSYTTLDGWTKKDLDTIIYNVGPYHTMANLIVGDAKNDGKNRIYGICSNFEIFEWTWDDTLNGVEQKDIKVGNDLKVGKILRVSPNPFYNFANVANIPNNAEIRIYDITGRLVEKTTNKNLGLSLKTGIYFIMAKGYKTTKIIKIK